MKTVAVAALTNHTEAEDARQVVTSHLLTRLYGADRISTIDATGQDNGVAPIDRVDARKLGATFEADAVLYGHILEYGYVSSPHSSGSSAERRATPAIGLHVRLVMTATGEVVWVGSITRTGPSLWSSERISLEQLAKEATTDLVAGLIRDLGVAEPEE
ncbi:MAG: GNA1162 family protein [Myxococcota bacterium]